MKKTKKSRLRRIVSAVLALTMTAGLTAVVPASADSLAGASKTYIGDGYSVRYDVVSAWDDHSNINVTLTNTGDEPIQNWALRYDTDGDIENIRDGVVFVSDEEYSKLQ